MKEKKPIFIRYRLLLILAPVFFSLAMLVPLRKAKINTDLMEYLREQFKEHKNIEILEAEFGKFDPVILVIESDDILSSTSLKQIKNLSEELNQYKEFAEIISIFETKYIRGAAGSMIVDPVIKRIPQTKNSREELRMEIRANPLAYRLLISDDFRYSLILVKPEKGYSDKHVFKIIEKVLAENPGKEKIYLNGLPYLRDQIQKLAIRDLIILMPLGLVTMMIFLYFSFGEWRAVFLPFSVVIMSILVAMGLLPLMGWDFSLIAVLVPIMMIAIANNYGVHLLMRNQELRSVYPEWNLFQRVEETVKRLRYPVLMTGITTIVGILGMAVHIMLPARQMGIVSAVGVAFALTASLYFIPAVMSGLETNKIKKPLERKKSSKLDRLLIWFGIISFTRPKIVIITFSALTIFIGTGIVNLNVAVNMENMMPAGHPLRKSTHIANAKFGGTKTISILFEGDIKSPEIMRALDRLEQKLKKHPETGSVTSIASVIRIISRAMNDPGDLYYDTIPADRNTIAQYLEFYSMSGDPEDFEQLVNFEYTKAILNIQFSSLNIKSLKEYESYVNRLLEGIPYHKVTAGQCLIEKKMSESIVRGQIFSLIFALAAIIILLGIIFRSVNAGILGSVPLLACLLCNFGLMGWLGIELDIASSLLSSVAIGIGIDYTIHLFWRLKYELLNGKSYPEAIALSLKTTGKGISINAISVIIGFSILFFSGLMILKTFALLIISSLIICLLCALVFVPAICIHGRPEFLQKNNTYHQKII